MTDYPRLPDDLDRFIQALVPHLRESLEREVASPSGLPAMAGLLEPEEEGEKAKAPG